MKKHKTQERVRSIYEMLFEMAHGNFSFQIPILNNGDEIDEISTSLNELSVVINKVMKKLGSDAQKFVFKAVLEPLVVVEDNSIIKSFRPHLPTQLGYDHFSFINLNFLKIIAPESKHLYNFVKENLSDDSSITAKFKLVFIGKEHQELHFYCTMEKHSPGNNVIISSVSNLFELSSGSTAESSSEKAKISIFEVYDFIVKNFDKPLPTTKELARMFKMNEFQIKDDFRKMFSTSIYQLYADVRLTYAHSLIVNTNFGLADIATQSGYATYLTFYRAFRNKYGCKPTDIKRKD
jgi:AraC-like DNA-binding protein